jgi:hypothetical protein
MVRIKLEIVSHYCQNLSLTSFYVSTKNKTPTCVANPAKTFQEKKIVYSSNS